MNLFLLENCYDGYEKSTVQGIFSSLDKVISKLKEEHPNGILKKEEYKFDDCVNVWEYRYKPYEDQYDENHWMNEIEEFYNITEYQVQ